MVYLVDFGRFLVRMMILSYDLFKWWIWVRDFGRPVGDLWKNLGLRLKMMKFQLGPLICENYSLVRGAKFKILDRIQDSG
jgi:hypothetical protein